MKRVLYALIALCLVVGGAGQAQAQPGYSYTTLDVPGSTYTQPNGINTLGQIVGQYYASRSYHGFLLSDGRYTALDVPQAVNTFAEGINTSGQIVGGYSAGGTQHGFLLSGGSYTALDVPGSMMTIPRGINDSGQIVGQYQNSSSTTHGFLLSGGNYTTLNVPHSVYTLAAGINASGQIVGQYYGVAGGSNGYHGFLLSGGSYTTLDVPDSDYTVAEGINDAGQVIGNYVADEISHGFLWDGVNYTTLDPPGSVLTFAYGINASGQIVGQYTDTGGREHGFLATPVSEPSTLLLLGIATVGLIGWAWRCRQQVVEAPPGLRQQGSASFFRWLGRGPSSSRGGRRAAAAAEGRPQEPDGAGKMTQRWPFIPAVPVRASSSVCESLEEKGLDLGAEERGLELIIIGKETAAQVGIDSRNVALAQIGTDFPDFFQRGGVFPRFEEAPVGETKSAGVHDFARQVRLRMRRRVQSGLIAATLKIINGPTSR
jgi:probable HAF family extracellular repeat protein